MASTDNTGQELTVVSMGTAVGPMVSDISQLRLSKLWPADMGSDGSWTVRSGNISAVDTGFAMYYLPVLNNGAAFVIADPNDGTPPGAWATIPDYIPWLDVSGSAPALRDSVANESDPNGSYPQFCRAVRDLPPGTPRYSGLTEKPREDLQAYAENWLAHVMGGKNIREGGISASIEQSIPTIPEVLGSTIIPPRDDRFLRYLSRGALALAVATAGGAVAIGEPIIAVGAGAGMLGFAL